MADHLLLEIGTEELPASFVVPALEELQRSLEEKLAAARLAHGPVRPLGTPRRLAVLVESVVPRSPDLRRQVLGPRVAYSECKLCHNIAIVSARVPRGARRSWPHFCMVLHPYRHPLQRVLLKFSP